MSGVLEKIVRGIVSVASSDVINKLTFVLFNFVVSRHLSVENFGYYSLAISLGNYLWPLVDGGFNGHAMKTVAQAPPAQRGELLGWVIGTRGTLACISFLLLVLFLFALPISPTERFTYLGALLFVTANIIFPSWLMRGVQDNLGYFISFAMVAGAMLVCIAIYTLLDPFNLNPIVAIGLRNGAWVIGAAAALLWGMKRLRISCAWNHCTPDWAALRLTYSLGISTIITSLLPVLPQISLRLMGLTQEVGYYSAALQIYQILIAGAGIIALNLVPMLATSLHTTRGEFTRLLKIHFAVTGAAALAVGGGFFLLGEAMIRLLYGANYTASTVLVPSFALVMVVVYLRSSLDAILIVFGHYRMMGATALASLAILLAAWGVIQPRALLANCQLYLAAEIILLLLNALLVRRAINSHLRTTSQTT